MDIGTCLLGVVDIWGVGESQWTKFADTLVHRHRSVDTQRTTGKWETEWETKGTQRTTGKWETQGSRNRGSASLV